MKLKKHILVLLERIGLTEQEAKFYLAVYQNPQKNINELQKIGGLSRTSAYRAFERLKEMKLISSSPKKWRKNVEAASLRSIGEKIGKESLKLRKAELELKKIENLWQMSGSLGMTDPVEILTDQNMITEECYKLLNSDWNHIRCYGSSEMAYEIPGHEAMSDFVSMRARRGKTIDAVFTELSDYTRELLKNNEKQLRNGKLHIDPASQNLMTYIYEKQITIWQKDQELGKRAIIIRDPGMINIFRNNFDKTWATV